jgi:hypothetical protein
MAVTIDGSAGVTTNTGAVYKSIQSSTAVTSTSGTSIDFTSIPSWVKRVTILGQGVSTNGTSAIIWRVGSGSIISTGYQVTQVEFAAAGVATTFNANTTAFDINAGSAAVATYTFKCTIELLGSNVYVATTLTGRTNATTAFQETGSITLSSTLDRVRITTAGGTDTFDAGSINILYE